MSHIKYECRHNVSLRGHNTFGMDVSAGALLRLTDAEQLPSIAIDDRLPRPFHVLGGGSNVLLTGDVAGTIILNRIRGISLIHEDAEAVQLRVGAGEVWHDLVLHAIGNGWGGTENLALIPGTVGASPIQNIGAYGVEVKDTIAAVSAWDWSAKAFRTFSNADCGFGYRDSIFKNALKDQVVITAVTFQFSKQPVLRTDYGAIRDELRDMSAEASVQSVAQAVINIRRSRLPDPAVIGNAGSFFKNPTISAEQFDALKGQFPAIPSYPAGAGWVKVPAAWLIEQCGWKGHRSGDAGVHAAQALVLVNYGSAKGSDIWDLSSQVLASVANRFGITLEREVQVW